MGPVLLQGRVQKESSSEGGEKEPMSVSQAWPKSSRGPAEGLVAANLGVPDGPPDVKDKLIREGEVTQPFIQGLSQLIRVPFVLSELHHGGRWRGKDRGAEWRHR